MATKISIDPNLLLTAAGGLISLAFSIWTSLRQIGGSDTIPEWQDLVHKNATLQAQIDAEKI
jgi:hypothetical protein